MAHKRRGEKRGEERRAMASRGGGDYRTRERRSSRCHRQNHQLDDQNWTLTPILDAHTPNEETSSSTSTPQDQKFPQNSVKFSWEPKNRGKKSRSARKCQKQVVADSSSKVEPGSGSNFGGVNGKEESSGSGAGLEISSDTVEIQGNKKDGGMKSNCEVDGDDEIVERLKEFRLSAEEHELPEELVSINNQLQEDEVLLLRHSCLNIKECVLSCFDN